MRWSRRKSQNSSSSSSSSSSRPSFMSNILPASWFSKLKQKKSIPRKVSVTEKRNSPFIHDYATNGNHARLCSECWKLPFRDDDMNTKKSGGISRLVWYNSEDEHRLPRTSCRTCRSKCTQFEEKEDVQNLEDMFSRMSRRRRRETSSQVKILRRESEIESRTWRSKYKENGNFKNLGKKVVERNGFKPEKAKERARRSVGKKMLEQEEHSGRDKTKLRSSSNEIDSNWERMKELKSRYERQRQPKGRRKIRVYSPRTEFCKIKPLEDMKKTKSKTKKKVRESDVEDETDLESFAIVKSSFDPQQDFKDSMVEMIMERRINEVEELEELLACYLTLNSDQYHDLIIKVFRQVWFDLNKASLESELHEQFSCNEKFL